MRDIPESPRILEIKKKQLKKRVKIFAISFFVFVGIVVGLSFLSKIKDLSVASITVEGVHVIDGEDVKNEIYQNLEGNYMYLFSRANFLIYPKDQIFEDLVTVFPRIESLDISIDKNRNLLIKIEERKGAFLYCGDAIPENNLMVGENCFFVNNDGLIFDKAPYFSGNIYFKFYLPVLGEYQDILGRQMLEPEDFHRVVRFVDGIEKFGFKPTHFLINNNDSNVYVYLKAKTGSQAPYIFFKNTSQYEDVLADLELSMKNKDFTEDIFSKYDNLLYLDLRMKNKIYYNFK